MSSLESEVSTLESEMSTVESEVSLLWTEVSTSEIHLCLFKIARYPP